MTREMTRAFDVIFSPFLDPMYIWILVGVGLALCLLAFVQKAKGAFARALVFLLFAGILSNPSILEEQRAPFEDTVFLIVDESPSQKLGTREDQTYQAVDILQAELAKRENLNVKTVYIGAAGNARDGTRIFTDMSQSLLEVPSSQQAGLILVSDGQIHDTPTNPFPVPVNLVLTGSKEEADRQIEILKSPSFGLLNKKQTLQILVKQYGLKETIVPLVIKVNHQFYEEKFIPANTPVDLQIPVEHNGENLIEFSTPVLPNELDARNNEIFVSINGVRERLRVLLISGAPHIGGRIWRDLLKSDPSVDLIHFTILRPPEKLDTTPVSELSLIEFPVHKLFVEKINEFDLIIFDRYEDRGVLNSVYLDHIAEFVRQGGAVLEATGPDYFSRENLLLSDLGEMLPGKPTGTTFRQPFTPALSEIGRRHPVTKNLLPDRLPVGPWLQQVDVEVTQGNILMTGLQSRPLIITDKVEEGRVGQIMSDQLWLWARGYRSGGPHTELLRRFAHWLMAEPSLAENTLTAKVDGKNLTITQTQLHPKEETLAITRPDGETEFIPLPATASGATEHIYTAEEPGLYRLKNSQNKTLAIVGDKNALEYKNIQASADKLRPLIEKSGGGIHVLADKQNRFSIRQSKTVKTGDVSRQLALKKNYAYRVVGVKERSLLPVLLTLILGFAAILFSWIREF